MDHISTHAPRTGSDYGRAEHGDDLSDFNPRSPHGERLKIRAWNARYEQFQPTLPARGATRQRHGQAHRPAISTHAPRTGSDDVTDKQVWLANHFNPRSPHGERHAASCRRTFVYIFQPTLPARGATLYNGLG